MLHASCCTFVLLQCNWTMEINGGSSAPYFACTPCVPLFVHCLIRVEAEGLLDYQGLAGIISIVRWNLRPVIFGVEFRPFFCEFWCFSLGKQVRFARKDKIKNRTNRCGTLVVARLPSSQKLPNSDLNFAVDFCVAFFLLYKIAASTPPLRKGKAGECLTPG